MKISVFTPSHKSNFLKQIYECLLEQTHQDWEWVVLLNNGAAPVKFDDPRVKVIAGGKIKGNVGTAKAIACEHCTGDVYVELDHDDLLTPDALQEVNDTFEANPEVGFAFSNSASCTGKFEDVERYAPGHGWKYRPFPYKNQILFEVVSFKPDPASITRIWYAPNHLRAFRASVYKAVGGHNRDLRVLDDLDLMCRMYLATEFRHIDKCLYIYRIHGANTWLLHNAEIQENCHRIHEQYIDAVMQVWSERNGLRKVELGGRMAATPGYETVDLKDADIIHDLNTPWPFEDGSVGVIKANDVFEHLKDPLFVMKELHRVLSPGGWALIQVPSTDGRGAFQDPTHVSFWNQNSFWYYTKSDYAKYIDTPVRFQSIMTYTTKMNQDNVCWVRAHLVCLKGGYVPPGRIEI